LEDQVLAMEENERGSVDVFLAWKLISEVVKREDLS
jgi:hypothetical protein